MRTFIDIVESQQDVTTSIMSGDLTLRWLRDDDNAAREVKEIKYFDYSEARHEIHVVIRGPDGECRAMGGFQINPYDEEQLWIKFVSVRPRYQGRGYAREIYEQIYPWAMERGLKIAPGSFTDEGQRLAHIHDEMAARYPSVAYQRDERGNYLNTKGQIIRRAG